jgi:uncharacterized repeat protein (TIGR02543 family)
MFAGKPLSSGNYDPLLIGWDAQALKPNVAFNGGWSRYCNGAAARANMISSDGWTIVDGGQGSCFTVTFDGNGGSGTMAPQINGVATYLRSNSFTRAGYSFTGWNTVANGSGTSYANNGVYNFTANATLYAQWSLTPHTVTFNANGGSGTMAPQSSSGAANLTANSFTRTQHTFTGWNTAVDGSGTAYANGASYHFSADIVLFAQWAINSYSVTFNANGGSGTMSNQSQNYNVTANLKANSLTRTGYTFIGWNTAANGSGTSYANGAGYTFTANATLYAQWSIHTYSVAFNANGGTGTMSNQSSNYNVPVALTANAFTRTGFTFTGWNTAANGTGTSYADEASYPFTASATLYAQWSLIPPTVTITTNQLTRSNDVPSCTYNLYHSLLPYSSFGVLVADMGTTYPMIGNLGGAPDYYYVGVDCGAGETAVSSTVGEFSFTIVPGSP